MEANIEENIQQSPEEKLWETLRELPDANNLYGMIRDWGDNTGSEDLEHITLDDIQELVRGSYVDPVNGVQLQMPNYTNDQYKIIQNAFSVYVTQMNQQDGGAKFWPLKYYKGLSKTKKLKRKREIKHFTRYHWKDPRAYKGFKTNVGVKTKRSSYTQAWTKLFPNAKSLKQKAQVTGVPLGAIQESYNRGMAAWRTGHRPGATQQQWGYARVHSFLMCGKTHYTTDSDLVRKAKKQSASAKRWWSKTCKKKLV